MTCEHCSKDIDAFDDYCSHCGVAVKPPTKMENRQNPQIKKGRLFFSVGGSVFIILFGVYLLLEIYFATGTQNFIVLTLLLVPIMLLFFFRFFVLSVYTARQERKLPLMKRVAVVAAKGKETKVWGEYEIEKELRGRSTDRCIIFLFPDNTSIRFNNLGKAYNELMKGDQVVLKYKRLESFTPIFYSYERIEERAKD